MERDPSRATASAVVIASGIPRKDPADAVAELIKSGAPRAELEKALAKIDYFEGVQFIAHKYAEHVGKENCAPLAQLAVKLMKASRKDTSDLEKGEMVEALVRALGEHAFPVVSAYRDKNTACRMPVYKLAVKSMRDLMRPLLVADLLAMDFEHYSEWGGITQENYVSDILEWTSGGDLGPAREQMIARLRPIRSKTIQRLVATHLGETPVEPERKPWPKNRGWFFDEYAAALAAGAVKAVRAARVAFPITELGLVIPTQEGLHPLFAVACGAKKERRELEIDAEPKTLIPPSIHDDEMLAEFLRRHGFDPDADEGAMPRWGDAFGIPQCLHYRELLVALRAVLPDLALPASTKVFTGCEDDDWTSVEGFAKNAAEHLRVHTPEFRREFTALCYRDEGKRRWLERLK